MYTIRIHNKHTNIHKHTYIYINTHHLMGAAPLCGLESLWWCRCVDTVDCPFPLLDLFSCGVWLHRMCVCRLQNIIDRSLQL